MGGFEHVDDKTQMVHHEHVLLPVAGAAARTRDNQPWWTSQACVESHLAMWDNTHSRVYFAARWGYAQWRQRDMRPNPSPIPAPADDRDWIEGLIGKPMLEFEHYCRQIDAFDELLGEVCDIEQREMHAQRSQAKRDAAARRQARKRRKSGVPVRYMRRNFA